MNRPLRIIGFFLCGLLPISFLAAQKAPWATGDSKGEDLTIQLVTADPGDEVYSWWGHTAIIVEDRANDIARLYNYGVFSFQLDNFYRNLAFGRLLFEVRAMPVRPALELYKQYGRSVFIQTLDLPPEKKVELALSVEDDIRPENRVYLYHHFFDNCATKIRDLLDVATNGELKNRTSGLANTTFRQLMRRFSVRSYPMDLLLMFLTADSIDVELRMWDEMFLPEKLAEYMDSLTVSWENGRQRPLVASSFTWYLAPDRSITPQVAPPGWPMSILLSGIFALSGIVAALLSRRMPLLSRLLYGVPTALYGLVVGLFGILLFFMNVFTDHQVTYFNENLFLANPFSLALFPLGILLIVNRGKKICVWVWSLLGGAVLISILLKVFPAFDQQNGIVIALISPICFTYAVSGWLKMRKSFPAS